MFLNSPAHTINGQLVLLNPTEVVLGTQTISIPLGVVTATPQIGFGRDSTLIPNSLNNAKQEGQLSSTLRDATIATKSAS